MLALDLSAPQQDLSVLIDLTASQRAKQTASQREKINILHGLTDRYTSFAMTMPVNKLQYFQAESLIYFNLMRQRQVERYKYRWSAVGAA